MQKLNKLKLLFMLFALFAYVNVSAQSNSVSGTVTDASDGQAIPGVTVFEAGTSNGTLTDFDGKYTISLNEGTTLKFSFLGYETQEVVVAGTVLDVQLTVSDIGLDEVIVIGYGTQKKTDKTGAVSNVTAKELNTGVLTDPIQGLQGKAAGVVISKQGGDPNSGFSVRIRGAAGFGSGTEPLYVIDGVPGIDPTTVAPEDIESFNILKDASSTAIYGARGANGVIIITTKKGDKNESKFSFSHYTSLDQVSKKLDLLSANQVRDYVDKYNIDFTDGGADTDWQDEIYQTGISQAYNFSASGGHENTTYYASINHSIFDGVIKGSSKERTTGRVNITQTGLDGKLKVTTGLSGTVEENQYINYGGWGLNDVLYQAFRRSPTDPVTNTDGTFNESDRMFNSKNPLATIEEIGNNRAAKRLNGNFKADLELFEGLVLGTNLAYIRNDNESFYVLPTTSYKAGEGSVSRSYNNYAKKILETTLSYNTSLKDIHNINAIAGYSYEEENWDGFHAGGSNTASNYVGAHNLSLLQNVNPGDISSYKSKVRLVSFFGRAAYNFQSKYYLTATVRRDGSSKFGDNKEWGIFPSVSAGWNIKEEGFLSSVDLISLLKLRAGYGLSGNQDIGNYLDQTIMVSGGTAIDPETGATVISFEGDKNPNPDLQWETNKELNVGIDYGLFNNKISGTIEYYNKTTTDLLAQYQVGPPTFKYNVIYANEGEIQSTGVEFDIRATAIDRADFKWKTTFTFSTNKQEVKSLDGGIYDIEQMRVGSVSGPGMVGLNAQVVAPGYELGTFFMPEYAGISSDGEFLFHTAAGGVTREISNAELRVVGSAQPDFEMGWSNQISFLKGFELNFSFRAVVGSEILNVTKLVFGNPNGLMPNGNVLQSALDEKERGLTDNATLSSYYLEDGSFIKLDNLTLAYNVDMSKVKQIKSLRVYLTSNNLLTLTNYSGIDPEITFSGLSFGIDQYNVYPKTRTLTFGLNVSF